MEKTLEGKANSNKICSEHEIPLKYLCIDSTCKLQKKLVCPECIIFDHSNQGKHHECISIGKFISSIQEYYNQNQSKYNDIISGYKEIYETKNKFDGFVNNLFDSEKELFLNTLDSLKETIISMDQNENLEILLQDVKIFLDHVEIFKIMNSDDIRDKIYEFPDNIGWEKAIWYFKSIREKNFFDSFSKKTKSFLQNIEEIQVAKSTKVKLIFKKIKDQICSQIVPFEPRDHIEFVKSLEEIALIHVKESYLDIYKKSVNNYICNFVFHKVKDAVNSLEVELYVSILKNLNNLNSNVQGLLSKILILIAKVLIKDKKSFINLLSLNRFIEKKLARKMKSNQIESELYSQICKFNKFFKKKPKKITKRPIVFLTPEIGEWSSVGGLGKMVDLLSKSLAKKYFIDSNYEVYVISISYAKMANIQSLSNNNFSKFSKNGQTYFIKKIDIITYVFIFMDPNSFGIEFSNPYISFKKAILRENLITNPHNLFSICTLEFLKYKNLFPKIVLTNDYTTISFSSLIRNDTYFFHKMPKLIHICHLLENSYFYYFNYSSPYSFLMDEINSNNLIAYSFPIHYVENYYAMSSHSKKKFNLTRAFVNNLDYFITCSPTYLNEIKPLLFESTFPSIGIINGINKQETIIKINQRFSSKSEAKKYLQQKYFSFQNMNPNFIIFSFIGRYALQKGFDVLLNAIEEILKNEVYKTKVQFLLGGYYYESAYSYSTYHTNIPYLSKFTKNTKDQIAYLQDKYPNNFWGNSSDTPFQDVIAVNKGSDYGLVPSRYEPCGLVQQEFFAAETPVISTDEGGLHDTVFDDEIRMNGVKINELSVQGIKDAVNDAIDIFEKKEKYQKMSENAKNFCVDVERETVDSYALVFEKVCELGLFEKDVEENLKNIF